MNACEIWQCTSILNVKILVRLCSRLCERNHKFCRSTKNEQDTNLRIGSSIPKQKESSDYQSQTQPIQTLPDCYYDEPPYQILRSTRITFEDVMHKPLNEKDRSEAL